MPNQSSLLSAMTRIFALLLFGMTAATVTADRVYYHSNLTLDERNFILTGDSEDPARDGISVTNAGAIIGVSDGDIELANYRFVWQLEKENPNGSWSVVTLEGGADAARSASEVVALDSRPENPDTPSTAFLAHSGKLKPENRLDPYARHRVTSRIERQPIFSPWSFVGATLTSSSQRYYHYTNTSSNDTARNVISTINNISVADPFILDESELEAYRGFEVSVSATARRWDGYLSGITSLSIPFHYEVELIDHDTGEQISIKQPDAINESIPSYALSGSKKIPSTKNFTHRFRVQPLEQIDPRKQYELHVTIKHNETASSVKTGNTVSQNVRLYHFNGKLDFNGIETKMSYFFRRLPASVTTYSNFVQTTIERAMGNLVSEPDWRWDTGVPVANPTTLVVRLYPDGTAVAHSVDEPFPVMPASGGKAGEIAGIRYAVPIGALSNSGLQGYLMAFLPQGIGLVPTDNSRAATGYMPFETELNNNLEPVGSTLNLDFPLTMYLVEESKPVGIATTDIRWDISKGEFGFSTTGEARYLREQEISFLQNLEGIRFSTHQYKKDNSGYYASISGISGSSITVKQGSDNSGKIDAVYTFSEGEFTTHFPYGSPISYNSGTMEIEENIVIDGSLSDVDPFFVAYLQNCLDGDCFDDLMKGTTIGVDIPELRFTPDGGFTGKGDLYDYGRTGSTSLEWGFIPSMSTLGLESFAHSLNSFTQGTFHATGHFISGTGGSESDFEQGGAAAKASNNGPANIHLAAVNQQLETARPGSSADRSGEYDYAGLNLRVADESDVSAQAIITGETIDYTPRSCSKFYLRLSGVTGNLEAEPGTFPEFLELAGYDVDIRYYGLGFINNETSPERSFVRGTLEIPGPTSEKFEFEGLSFTCLGGLDEMRLPEGGSEKRLRYWSADLDLHTFSFVSSDSCDPSASAFAALGVTAFSTFIEEPLHGVIGIKPDGTLITHQFSKDEGLETLITSRLRLPNNIRLTGPAEEVYELTAVSEAYFNDFDSASSSTHGDGRLNFAAKINVPFFEDLRAHVRSTASRNTEPESVVHLAGGWTDEDDTTFFDSKFFDPENRAYPATSGVSEKIYFNLGDSAENTDYLVHAEKKWLKVVNFSYPLKWSPSLRSFEGYDPQETDLMIVTVDHQLEYLSAENAEISFGAVYQGMPRINVTNFVFNKIDEGTGVLQAMTESLQEEAVGALTKGLDAFDSLLDDQIDGLIDEFLQETVDPIIDDFYSGLADASQTVDNANDWKNSVVAQAQDYITGTTSQYAGTVRGAIGKLSEKVDDASSLIFKIDNSLEEVQLALRVVYGEIYRVEGGVSLDPPNPNLPDADAIYGLLTTDSNGQFQIVETLVHRLIAEFAGDLTDEVGTILENILQESTAELNDLINEQIDKVRPALERVREVVEMLDGKIQLVRDQLEVGGEFIGELEAILTAADDQVKTAADEIKETVESFVIADIPSPDQFIEISADDVKSRIRQEIGDKIGELEFIRQYQLVIRQKLADIDLAVKEGIDTAFSQVNTAIKNLVGEYLMEIDDKINGFLGDLGDSLGAGEIDGFAHIRGDSLKLLRLDAYLQLLVPDELEFNGYLQIKQLNSDGSGTCSSGDETSVANEVTMGALGVPVEWISPGMHIDVEGKVSFQSEPSFKPLGLGGSFEMVDGEIGFEMLTITELGAAMSFGATENYIAAKAGLIFQSYEVYGGIFFGRACSIAPLELVSPQAASVLGEPPFTGAYVYGEAHIPVSEVLLGIPASCMFKITAGVGVGAFYFAEGPTYGGQMLLGASGEALCLVSIKGEISLVGVKVADDFRFNGRGSLKGKVGSCPFCVKFGKSLELEYRNDRWKFSL